MDRGVSAELAGRGEGTDGQDVWAEALRGSVELMTPEEVAGHFGRRRL
jgi:hypothetical protein